MKPPINFIVIMFFGLFIIWIILLFESKNKEAPEVYRFCCDNKVCTDTYYDQNKSRCVLVQCEHTCIFGFRNNCSSCYYEPNFA